MFEVGFTELLLISALALIVLGPERLPRVASQLGRWVGRARAMARQFREQLDMEAQLESLSRPSHKPPASPPASSASEMTEIPAAADPALPRDSEHAPRPPESPHERGA